MGETQLANAEDWVDQYGDYLFRFAVRRVYDPEVAQDLVQETFLAALAARQASQGVKQWASCWTYLSTGMPTRVIH